MAQKRKRSRLMLTILSIAVVGAALGAAFWPRAVKVDLAIVTKGAMSVTIDQDGRTRVRDAYVVSTPIAGRLQRVEVQPGDQVLRGKSVVARMLPINPAALDIRTREQAHALVTAAEAALRVARADLNAAMANRDLAESELKRTRQLQTRDLASEATVDRALQTARVANANTDTAKAAIAMREAEVANARAQLIGFDDQGLATAIGSTPGVEIPLYAPVDGRILRIIQKSETTLPAGTPVMEIGNIEGDLEIVVELLSTDAVQVAEGDPVMIEDWGGKSTLSGKILRVDPFGITQFSALGVEEQRVTAVISLNSPPQDYAGLGHGFRVEARIVVWQTDNTLIIPTAALFRNAKNWAVFAERDGRAVMQAVEIGHNNGVEAELLGGLLAGDQVVLYPSPAISDGSKIAQREVN